MVTTGQSVCACCALLVITTNLAAQRLGGTVRDAATGAPVAGVTLTAIDAGGSAQGTVISDSTGTFHLILPRAERYQLRVEHVSYAAYTTDFARVRRGESIAVEIRMGRQVVELAPLVVVGRRRHPVSRLTEFHDRMARQQKLGLGRFITRADIEQTASIDVHAVLRREPSISIVRTTAAPSAVGTNLQGPPDPADIFRAAANARRTGVSEVVTFNRRGGAGCTPMIFLDGAPLGRAEFVQLTSFVSVDEIEGIEIYRSGLETPGELADGCGAIGVWTRRASATQGNPFTWPRMARAAGFLAAGFVVLSLLPN